MRHEHPAQPDRLDIAAFATAGPETAIERQQEVRLRFEVRFGEGVGAERRHPVVHRFNLTAQGQQIDPANKTVSAGKAPPPTILLLEQGENIAGQ